jgi:HSP20 family molecular chaperone IbpA
MLRRKLSLLALPLVAAVSLQAQNPFNDPFFQDPFGDDIFKEMIQMQRQMDEMFQRMQQRINQRSTRLVSPLGTYKLAPQSQFVDKGDHYEMVTNIPESKENHIDIHTENGMLSVTAKIVHEKETKTNGMVSTSRSVQMFQQSTALPADADENGIKSSFVNGKLVITIPKKQGAKAVVSTPVSQTANSSKKPVVETVKIPTLEKKKETTLPKVDEDLKKKQPAAGNMTEKKSESKTTSVNDHASMS